jgi:hypothetical protein
MMFCDICKIDIPKYFTQHMRRHDGFIPWNKGKTSLSSEKIKLAEEKRRKSRVYISGQDHPWTKNNPMLNADIKEKARKSKKGIVAWNKGLDKTDPRVAQYGNNVSEEERIQRSNRMNAFNATLTKEQKIARMRHCLETRQYPFPNNCEKTIISLQIPSVKFVGDAAFWIRLKNRAKNPDFLITPFFETYKVIEFFGDFWHTREEADELIAEYFEKHIQCLILFQDDLEYHALLREKILNFINFDKEEK